MARRAATKEGAGGLLTDNWPAEWTCGFATVVFILAFCLSGQVLPRFFIGQCTAQQGMCTAEECTCVAPKIKRELVTQDALPCFQCVDEFCPAVAEGDTACSASTCECEDPTWPRVNIAKDGAAECWQCVHPPLDFTLRAGAGGAAGAAGADASCLAAAAPDPRRLEASEKAASCLVFRYNGATIVDKRDNWSCITWSSADAFWSLANCSGESPPEQALSRFQQRPPAAGSSSEMFCAGATKSEFCVEPHEYMCTTDPTQCSMGACRCENPGWVKQELKTLNGTTCYTCTQPAVSCPIFPAQCFPGNCECRGPDFVKVVHTNSSSPSGAQAPCYSCRRRESSGGSFASTVATFVVCIFTGLVAGCGLQRLWPGPSSPQAARRRRAACEGPRTWSERWAEHLEDAIDAAYGALAWAASACGWARPPLKHAGYVIGWALDKFDDALDPFHCALDALLAKAGDVIDAARARLNRDQDSDGEEDRPQDSKGKREDGTTKGNRINSPVSSSESAVALNPLLKAAACIMEKAEQSQKLDNLKWDPLDLRGGAPAEECAPAVTLPKEWMLKMINPGAPPAGQTAAASQEPAGPTQRRALRRLQQRREAAAAAAAEKAQQRDEPVEETPIDESWIDEVERSDARAREAKQKAEVRAAKQKEKKATRAKRPQRQVSGGSGEGEEEAVQNAEDDLIGQAADEQAGVQETAPATPSRDAALAEDSDDQSPTGVEHLLALVGAAPEDAMLMSDRLASEALNGLFLLASGGDQSLDVSASRADDAAAAASAGEAQGGRRKGKSGKKSHNKIAAAPHGEQSNDAETERHAKEQAEQKAKQDADRRAKKEAERKARGEADRKAAEEAERKAKDQAERKAQEQAARKARQEAERRAKQEAERKAKEEAEQRSAEVAERKAKQEAERRAKVEAERKAKEEAERRAKQEAELRRAKEAAERRAKEQQQEAGAAASAEEDAGRAVARKGWADVVGNRSATSAAAGEPHGQEEAPAPGTAAAAAGAAPAAAAASPSFSADAPEFVPFSMMAPAPPPEEDAARPRERGRRGRRGQRSGTGGSGLEQGLDGSAGTGSGEEQKLQQQPQQPQQQQEQQQQQQQQQLKQDQQASGVAITTVMISGIPSHHTPETFREQLDAWGLLGTYDFFYMPSGGHMASGYAFVNFIDPTFATLCQWLFQQYPVEGTAGPFHVQGLDGNIAHWSQYAGSEDMANAPLVIQSPSPSQWAVNGVNMMLNSKFSPQIREQFHKTKMCVFYKRNKCALASSCPFAHSKDELQAVPDLAKTKLCYNFFRRKCNDSRCKFAHGYQELRATDGVYKTELCRWWSYGSCKAGDACRYAHGVEELRVQPGPTGMAGMPLMPQMAGFTEFGEASDMGMPQMHSVAPEMAEAAEPGGSLAPGAWNRQASATSAQGARAAQSPGAAAQDADSVNDGASDMGLSDVSTFLGMDSRPKRQQTAPPAPMSSRFSGVTELRKKASEQAEQVEAEGHNDTVVLRVKGTFIESVQLNELNPPPVPMRRSWSDGDLGQLMEVMEGMGELDEEF